MLEYAENIWNFNGEEQIAFQTVLLCNVDLGTLRDIKGKKQFFASNFCFNYKVFLGNMVFAISHAKYTA